MIPLRLLVCGLAAVTLSGCDVRDRLDAAEGVRGFVAAAQSGDRKAFEAHIDRPKLRESLKAQLRASSGVDPEITRRLDTPEGRRAVDGMITPDTFRIGFRRMGVAPAKAPSAPEIAASLKMLGEDRACIRSGPTSGDCVMTFERQGEIWKLVAVTPTEMKVETRRVPATGPRS
jgi:hypothetical protein